MKKYSNSTNVLVVFFLLGSSMGSASETLIWNEESALIFLDRKASEWDAWEKSQRSLETTCISCHTGGPYLLARPSLQRYLDSAPDHAVQKNLIADVETRVEKWDTAEPWYAFNDVKKSESLGTEAIWNTVILSYSDHYDGVESMSTSTVEAFDVLWKNQNADGHWPWLDFKLEPFESKNASAYGASLAAVAVGKAPGNYAESKGIQEKLSKLKKYLRSEFKKDEQFLHNQIFILWASIQLEGILSEKEHAKLVRRLKSIQRNDGGWSLSDLGTWRKNEEQPSDGYATGLVTFVLREAGLEPRDESVGKGLGWLMLNQDVKTGGWTAKSVNKKRNPETFSGQFMNDAASAYAVLALTNRN